MWKENGSIVIPVVASVLLARKMVEAGADAVIAEGGESGGHVGDMTTMTLVPQMVDALDVPVIAAGGIADGRQMAAAYALGACGVQIGTCLLVSEECPIHINYKNALIKARAIAEHTDAIVLADDSGLEVDYMNKEPGVFSARWMGEDTSYDIKNQAIIDKLDGVEKDKRTARFVCAIGAVLPDKKELVVRETMEGIIGYKAEGENGFGYDPIFFPNGFECSSAALSREQKNDISHRGKALRAIKNELEKYFKKI